MILSTKVGFLTARINSCKKHKSDAMPSTVTDEFSSRRKLGNGYSLALNTGSGTHLTLILPFVQTWS